MKKSKIVNLFTTLVLLLTILQGLIPSVGTLIPESSTMVISAILMFLVSGFTAWKQALSVEISNSSLWPTFIVAIIATIGGLNQLFDVIPIGETAGQWLRFSITAITAVLNIASKMFWPTPETKSSL